MRSRDTDRRSGPVRRHRSGAAWVAFVVMVMVHAASTALAAKLPNHFDSLVFAADDIVEGTVVEQEGTRPVGAKVTSVEAGTLTVGQTIFPEDLSSLLKPETGWWPKCNIRLQAGDRVILFLNKHSKKLTRVVGGTFLVIRGRAITIGAQRPMGSMNLSPERLRKDSPTVAEFRKAVADELIHSTTLHALLDPPADRKNAPRMLALLSSRATGLRLFWEPPDVIADTAANRLLGCGDCALAAETIEADPVYAWGLRDRFWSRSGREYLIRRIADRSVPAEKRERLVPLLAHEGGYRDYFLTATTMPSLPDGAPGKLADDFVKWTGLAETTAREDERLAGLVLREMERPLSLAAHCPPASTPNAAALNAERALRALYLDPSTPDSLKYWIERTTAAISADAYQRLQSPCGQLMTLATPPNLTQYAAPKPHMLAVGYEYRDVQQLTFGTYPAAPPITSVYLVLEPRSGGSTFVLPSTIIPANTNWTQGSGVDATPLPPGFAPGKYRVHYRLMSGSSIVSEGHGVDLQIPQPGLRVMPTLSAVPIGRLTRIAWKTSWTVCLVVAAGAPFLLRIPRQLVRSHQRIAWFQSGLCPACGYDLRASGERCPECGSAVSGILPIQVLRRRVLGIVGMTMLSSGVLLTLLFVRSYFVGDVVTRTMTLRADAAWTSRGVLALQWLTIGSEPGWLYEREKPADLPVTAGEAGPPAEFWLFGLEYSFGGRMLVVPLWIPVVLLVLAGGPMWRARKPQWIVRRAEAITSPAPSTA